MMNFKSKISMDKRQSWTSLAMIWIGSMICVPCLMIGGLLASGFDLSGVIICTVIGYGIVCLYMCFMGMEACDTGRTTVEMAGDVLGEKGAKYVISLMLGAACIGWFGIQSAVCGSSFSSMIFSFTGFQIPVWISTVVWGALMVITAAAGYKGLKILNYIAVPALLVVIVYGIVRAFAANGGTTIVSNYIPSVPMNLVTGISLTVATFALGGVISGDYSRFAKNRKDVVKSSVIGVLPIGIFMIACGAVLTMVTGKYDISDVLVTVGVPAFGLIALILATWTTNVTNCYSGGLAIGNLLGIDESKFSVTVAIAGGIGTLLGAIGLLGHFASFLSVLTAFIPPIAGVMITSYWIIGKGKGEDINQNSGFDMVGIIAFVLGALVAYYTGSIKVFLIAPINGIVISGISYYILRKVVAQKKVALEVE
ncbi:MAG: cytosine permease [Sphaerochaetaceae bacterium]|nr:cytosine permease [Sphaerochaetaceae bacterium]